MPAENAAPRNELIINYKNKNIEQPLVARLQF